MLRKNDAARIRPEFTISSFGTAARYAIWLNLLAVVWREKVTTYIYQHVQDRNQDYCSRSSSLQRSNGFVHFREGIIGIAIPNIAPDNVV